jgi:hypothetical protein
MKLTLICFLAFAYAGAVAGATPMNAASTGDRAPASPATEPQRPTGALEPAPRLWNAQLCPWATVCVTPYGVCYLGQPLCRGAPCYCPTIYGPAWGYAD